MELPPLGHRLPRREALGALAALLLLAGGRLIRRWLLVGPDGAWRDNLWCDEILAAQPDTSIEGGGAPTPARPARAARPRLTTPLPVNTCSEDSLTLLPGVGPRLAARLAASRREQGPFRNAADLERVKGIGPALAARIAPLVHFGAPDGNAAADSLRSP